MAGNCLLNRLVERLSIKYGKNDLMDMIFHPFSSVHKLITFQTLISLSYVSVPLDFRPRVYRSAIIEVLAEHGLEMSLETFKKTLYRIRKKRGKTPLKR